MENLGLLPAKEQSQAGRLCYDTWLKIFPSALTSTKR